MGRAGATAALTLFAIAAAEAAHFMLGCYEGGPIQATIFANIALETVCVATPIIYYSRYIIEKLTLVASRAPLARDELAAIADRAEGSSRAKSAFIANMSHELRTPLNAIMGFAEVMKDQHLGPVHNPRYLSYAADIHASGRHLLGIINDILDLSKIEAGKMTLECAEEFALGPTVEAAVTILAALAEKFGVSIETDTGHGPPLCRRTYGAADRHQSHRQRDQIHAARRTRATGADAEEWRIRRAVDTGVGMSEEDIARALTPFGRVSNAMSRKHNDTGLGLRLAKAMLELHGGKDGNLQRSRARDVQVMLNFRRRPRRRPARRGRLGAARRLLARALLLDERARTKNGNSVQRDERQRQREGADHVGRGEDRRDRENTDNRVAPHRAKPRARHDSHAPQQRQQHRHLEGEPESEDQGHHEVEILADLGLELDADLAGTRLASRSRGRSGWRRAASHRARRPRRR